MYGWEEKKTKASSGGTTVDYQDIAGKAVREMKPHDVQHFLIVCALISDQYCPGYNPRETLAKNSNLSHTAARYKIGTAKLGAAVRAELSKSAKALPSKNLETKAVMETKTT